MKISIITATYNSIKHLPDVLNSIKEQSYTNYEHIVIDGGSTDGTLELLQNSGQVHQLVSEKDKGIYDALNKGIRLATGDIIGFLHSDDLFASDQTLQHIVNGFTTKTYIQAEPKMVEAVYGDLVFVDQQDILKVHRFWKSEPYRSSLLQGGWMPPHPTLFMRREVYEKHGLFDIQLRCAADYDYILRVFKDKSLVTVYLPEVITRMRIGGISTKGFKNLINKKKEDYWVLLNNHMPFPLWILLAKNLSKIPQLIFW